MCNIMVCMYVLFRSGLIPQYCMGPGMPVLNLSKQPPVGTLSKALLKSIWTPSSESQPSRALDHSSETLSSCSVVKGPGMRLYVPVLLVADQPIVLHLHLHQY